MPDSRPLRVFLCHSSGDKPTVRELYRQLDAEGWLDVWLDEEKLLPGHNWDMEIEKAVEAADAVIVCLSNNSVTREGYVQAELGFVLDIARTKPEETIFVIPLRLDDCLVPRRLRTWQYVDYFPRNQRTRAFQRLLASLKLRASRLDLLPEAPGQAVSTHQSSTNLPAPVITSPGASPKPGSPATDGAAAKKKISIWIYGRLLVLIMLFSGFFGPWYELTSCSPAAPVVSEEAPAVESEPGTEIFTGLDHYQLMLSTGNAGFILMQLVLGGLIVITAVRLFPSRLGNHEVAIRLERLTSGLAPITMLFEMIFLFLVMYGSKRLLWGIWLSMAADYLAPLNVFLEYRSTLQKRQKWPWWLWLLAVSIILPVLLFLLLIVWLRYS